MGGTPRPERNIKGGGRRSSYSIAIWPHEEERENKESEVSPVTDFRDHEGRARKELSRKNLETGT